MPYAAVGNGPPLVVFAGLMPVTGVASDGVVNSALHPLLPLARSRRLVLFNRRDGLPRGMTMADLAREHADALRDGFATPVDLAGTSTGGTIAAQFSADHGELVARLALISAACRLGPVGKQLQAQVAAAIRSGRYRRAAATAAAGLVPPWRGKLIVAGRDDRFYSPALFEQTAQLIAASRLHLISGRGHITVTRDRSFGPTLGAFFG